MDIQAVHEEAPLEKEKEAVIVQQEKPERGQADPTRPTYHIVSRIPSSHIADPNFAFFWKGRYHLFFFIGDGFEHISSSDMVHWRWHSRPGFGGLSGTMFLQPGGVPTIITKTRAISLYTALDDDLESWSHATWIEASLKPGQDGSWISDWDPDAWTEGETTYVLLGEYPLEPVKEAALLKSTDMKTWELVGPFMARHMPEVTRSLDVKTNDDISCPNFFPIGDKWMLLCISHRRGCRYYLGDWKDEIFTPDFHGWMNWSAEGGLNKNGHGGDIFAPESLLTPDGRRVMWAWLFGCSHKRVSDSWHEVLSLPRELSLPEDGVLRIKPLRELEELRHAPVSLKAIKVEDGEPYRLEGVSGDATEVMVTMKQGAARRYGVRLFCGRENAGGLDLVVEPAAGTIKVGSITAPFHLKAGEEIRLRIFVDRSVVEVFANDRQAMAKQYEYAPGDVGVCLFSEGGRMEVPEVRCWQMKAAPL